MDDNAKVFLIAPRRNHRFFNAKQFGELVRVFNFDHSLNLFNLENDLELARESILNNGFNPETDCVCLIGQPLYLVIFMLALQSVFPQMESVRLLIFLAQEQEYQLRHVYLRQEICHGKNETTNHGS